MEHSKRIAFCHHCGNIAPQKLIHIQEYAERLYLSNLDGTPAEEEYAAKAYFIAVCETCSQILVYEGQGL